MPCGIDFDVIRDKTLVLLGGSGGGKSVHLKHLPGLIRPWKGTVEVDGTEIPTLNQRLLAPFRRKVGIMFQGKHLPSPPPRTPPQSRSGIRRKIG